MHAPALPQASYASAAYSIGGAGEAAAWDAGAAWRPWAVHVDPVGCLELDVVWEDLNVWGGGSGGDVEGGGGAAQGQRTGELPLLDGSDEAMLVVPQQRQRQRREDGNEPDNTQQQMAEGSEAGGVESGDMEGGDEEEGCSSDVGVGREAAAAATAAAAADDDDHDDDDDDDDEGGLGRDGSAGWPLLQASAAAHWMVHALHRGLTDDSGLPLGLFAAERVRQHVVVHQQQDEGGEGTDVGAAGHTRHTGSRRWDLSGDWGEVGWDGEKGAAQRAFACSLSEAQR